MNLHEECLLKYLSNPVGISLALENLQAVNHILSQKNGKDNLLAYQGKISYTANRRWE